MLGQKAKGANAPKGAKGSFDVSQVQSIDRTWIFLLSAGTYNVCGARRARDDPACLVTRLW